MALFSYIPPSRLRTSQHTCGRHGLLCERVRLRNRVLENMAQET